MKIDARLNYVILANKIDKQFLNNFSMYTKIGKDVTYDELVKKLEFFPSKQVLFVETFYSLRKQEKLAVLTLLEKQNITYINITSEIEDAIYADYICVYDGYDLIVEGLSENILTDEKTLKRIGYGVPFVVDMSLQLNYYEIMRNVCYSMKELVLELWN